MKLQTNPNGVNYIVDGNTVYCEYYLAEGATLKKTFIGLSKSQIKKLSLDDLTG